MSPFRSATALAVGALLSFGVGYPAAGQLLPVAAAPRPANNSHSAHLMQAEKDLLAAEAALLAKNPAGANQAIAAAEKQVGQARTHHNTVVAKFPMGYGLTGLIVRAQHQTHHGLLSQAESHMHNAQKSLKAGNATAALEHVELSGRMIKASLLSHNHLFPN